MKGVSKRVIEIIEPDNDNVERILIFLKPGVKNVRVSHQKAEAEKYVSGLVCFSKLPFFKASHFAVLCVGMALVGAFCSFVFFVI